VKTTRPVDRLETGRCLFIIFKLSYTKYVFNVACSCLGIDLFISKLTVQNQLRLSSCLCH